MNRSRTISNRLWLPFELPATVPSPLTGFGTVVTFVDRLVLDPRACALILFLDQRLIPRVG